MAPGVDEAQRQRELTKQALARSMNRVEQKVAELRDWRTRLRKDGPRIAALGGAVIVVVGGLVLLRSRLRGRRDEEPVVQVTLDDLAAEVHALSKRVAPRDDTALWQKALLRGVAAAGAAGGTYAAKRFLDSRAEGEAAAEAAMGAAEPRS